MPRKTLILALALAAGAATPAVRSTAKALLLLTEVVPSPVKPLQWSAEPRFSEVSLPDGSAHLYESKVGMPGIVLVHGVAPGGPADPRMKAVAVALNRLGRTVIAPSLGLGEQRLDRRDPARIRQAIDYLSDKTGGKVMVLAFSFGAGFALVALGEEPEIQDQVLEVATVGTYYDLVHLLQGVTAGRVSAAGGTNEWSPDPRAGLAVTEFLAKYLPAGAGNAVVQAYKERDPSRLPGPARPIYDLMTNTDPARTRALVDALPLGIGQTLADLSPSTHVDRIRVPVRAMHSRQDPATPPSESELLIAALRPPAQGSLTKVGSFRHVTPATGVGLLKDAGPLIGYTSGVIRAQEGWGFHF